MGQRGDHALQRDHLTETRGSSSFASTSCRLPMDSILTLRGTRLAAAAGRAGSSDTNGCSGVGCAEQTFSGQ